MLYRKRAWDIMRSEFPMVNEDASIGDVVKAIESNSSIYPDNDCALVSDKDGKLMGAVSMWNIVKAMGPELLKSSSRSKGEESFEKAFQLACQLGAQAGIRKIIQKDVPRIRPNDTLARIMEVFLDYRQGRAVVEEGGKVMGVVMLSDVYREIVSNI
ncbi:MAG: CBS domain-containing protein [Desulfonatronovibrio sp. MSAO_Bac4]|nr:MAG: CBS domain-containing protein [Desulfonatronovibrio sp. MSAO_Bac4]